MSASTQETPTGVGGTPGQRPATTGPPRAHISNTYTFATRAANLQFLPASTYKTHKFVANNEGYGY